MNYLIECPVLVSARVVVHSRRFLRTYLTYPSGDTSFRHFFSMLVCYEFWFGGGKGECEGGRGVGAPGDGAC